MLQDMLSFLLQRLFGRTDCEAAGNQEPEKKESEVTGNSREEADIRGKTSHSSDNKEKETSKSNVPPKKTTVLIMVAPPMDFPQVGKHGELQIFFTAGIWTLNRR